jgi:cytochrome bd ubiquinol oxidase subunit II
MDLNILWFVLIGVLWTGFFVLEGFDFGVGMLLPFLGKSDTERRMIINTIGPHWDGNEVWLITAGGAMFAAFPHWYATMFSGFYEALFLLLVALIIRGVAFEFRSKVDDLRWRKLWDWSIFTGSFLAALLFGVAFANIARGIPIDGNMNYTGGFWYLLNPYGLIGGLTAVGIFLYHGVNFLSLKTSGELLEKTRKFARPLAWIAILLMLVFTGASYIFVDIIGRLGINPGLIPTIPFLSILVSAYLIRRKREGWAFILTSIAITFTLITQFMVMFPNVMRSTLNPEWSLTIYNASSSEYTLTVLSILALIFIPIVLLYQGWSYWVFRKRITSNKADLEY